MANNNDLPPSTPLDVRQGITDAKDIAHPLRWGILGTGNISAQWVWCLQQVPGRHDHRGRSARPGPCAGLRRSERYRRGVRQLRRHGGRVRPWTSSTSAPSPGCTRNTRCSQSKPASTSCARSRSRSTPTTPPRCTLLPRPRASCSRTPCGPASSPPSSMPGSPSRRASSAEVSLVQSDFFDPDLHIPGSGHSDSVPTPRRRESLPPVAAEAARSWNTGKARWPCSPSHPPTPNSRKSPKSSAPKDESPSNNRAIVRPGSPSAYRPPAACRHATGRATCRRRFSTSNTRCPATSECQRGTRTSTGSCTKRRRCTAA